MRAPGGHLFHPLSNLSTSNVSIKKLENQNIFLDKFHLNFTLKFKVDIYQQYLPAFIRKILFIETLMTDENAVEQRCTINDNKCSRSNIAII